MDIRNKKILITGGAGFLGSHICDYLDSQSIKIESYDGNCQPKPGTAYTFRSEQIDLTNLEQANWIVKKIKPDLIIHLAAVVGGIGANQKNPGTYYYKNLMMGTNIIEAAKTFKTPKILLVGTICSYPKFTPAPFKEMDLWNGYPEETNAPYGIAKKALLVQAEAYKKEFGLNYTYVMPVNLYGPRDNFDLDTSHVIPALIRKCADARRYKKTTIECWGTGTPTREFLFVKDAAEAIIKAASFYEGTEPVNIGSGQEISIKDLVDKIARIAKYSGDITWNDTKPDGQPKRCLDTTKAQAKFGFTARTTLDEGLHDTIKWYEHTYLNSQEYRDK